MKVSTATAMSSSTSVPLMEPRRPRYQSELRELVDTYLARTPWAKEACFLEEDIRKLHPLMLGDALRELIAGRSKGEIGVRSALLIVYGRKMKEMAALYPLAFSVENALRARVAEATSGRFGYDTWWRPIRFAMKNGQDPQTVKEIMKVPITSKLARRVGDIIAFVDGERLTRDTTEIMTCGSAFLAGSTFGQLRYLVIDSWSVFDHLFDGKRNGLRAMSKEDFASLSKAVNDTRNDLYHHNPVAYRQRFIEACERIADHLDLHLGSIDAFLTNARYTRPEFDVTAQDRHCADYPTG
ncbi:hypothetical protein NDN16_09785 [Aureimonas altamirensis]|uniref:hypothetical protein n=1 Tax=Aureimonas altamirensis TaxID=370622 RepID=UPI002037610A|nr:hypothetical protein [Aureimonas altamirensis]MCM2503964.1 hypothetical protein [Aureimonas altamirensis]